VCEAFMTKADYDPTTYGDSIADDYDDMYEHVYDTGGAVAFVADLAQGGSVLELGIGTGRLALPLAQRGVEVHGVDASPAMLDKLRTKPGADQIEVTTGDFATVQLRQEYFSVVLLAINTIFAVPDQDAQVAVFENAARHLAPGGRFVLEAWVPDLGRFRRGQGVWPRHVGADFVSIEVGALDAVHQRMETTQIRFGPDGPKLYPANHRYAWPAELDLMGRIAGMRLCARWQDWARTPFTTESETHVSVYERPDSPARVAT
jgi:SAM-dependent methyltransferase